MADMVGMTQYAPSNPKGKKKKKLSKTGNKGAKKPNKMAVDPDINEDNAHRNALAKMAVLMSSMRGKL